MLSSAAALDERVFIWVSSHHHPAGDLFLPLATHLGVAWMAGLILVLLCLAAKGPWLLRTRLATFSLAVLGLSLLGNSALKSGFDRRRPAESFARVAEPRTSPGGPSFAPRILGERPRTASFPSGHTQSAFLVATLVTGLLGGRHMVAYAAAYAIASLVGYSRIYLGVHFPADVLGGALVGITLGSLAVAAWRRLEGNQTERA